MKHRQEGPRHDRGGTDRSGTHRTGRLPRPPGPVQALAAIDRRTGRHPDDGRRRARRPGAGLRAEAELLRPRRGHRALRRGAAAALEHPEVRTVVITSAKPKIFCAGANIRMLAASPHGWKVNFCKFTNETRNGIEDATAHSGQTYLAAVNGTASGGGYEL